MFQPGDIIITTRSKFDGNNTVLICLFCEDVGCGEIKTSWFWPESKTIRLNQTNPVITWQDWGDSMAAKMYRDGKDVSYLLHTENYHLAHQTRIDNA